MKDHKLREMLGVTEGWNKRLIASDEKGELEDIHKTAMKIDKSILDIWNILGLLADMLGVKIDYCGQTHHLKKKED